MAVKKKPLTKLQKLQRDIARRNKIFEAASPTEKRVLIAKDVIAQIKAERYKPDTGVWVHPMIGGERAHSLEEHFDPAMSLRELFLGEKIKSCNCCALGAMFMSCTLYNNQTTVADFESEIGDDFSWQIETKKPLSNDLNKFFSTEQLKLIEIAYEGNSGAFDADRGNEKKLEKWMDKLPDNQKRMVAIMQNIIDNNGKFVP